MTAEEILAQEEVAQGQPCELLDSAVLRDPESGTEVTVILYSSTHQAVKNLGAMRSARFAVVSEGDHVNGGKTSGIAATTWPDREARS